MEILEVKTSRERQAQTLYSANDYIKYTSGVETYVCSNPVLLGTIHILRQHLYSTKFNLTT